MKREVKKVNFDELEFKSSEEVGYAIEDAPYFIMSHLQQGYQWDLLERAGENKYLVRVTAPSAKESGVYEMTEEELRAIPLGILKTPQIHLKLDEAKVTEQLRKRGMI